MPSPVTTLALFKNLVVSAGYPAPRGGGGHMIRRLGANEWIGVASADSSGAMRPYYTNDNWATVALTGNFAENLGANIVSAMLRDGTQVVIGSADAGVGKLAGIERSTDTGQSYTLVQDISAGESSPGVPADNNIRAYTIIKLSNGTYLAGCGQGSPEWWTSPTMAVWTRQTKFVAWDAINELWEQSTILDFLEVGGERVLAVTNNGLNPGTAGRIYAIESLMTGAVTIRLNPITGSGTPGIKPGFFFRAASGTIFCTFAGVHRSTDNGSSWVLISGTTGAYGRVSEIFGTLCVAKSDAAAVLFSIDDGVTWATITGSGAAGGFECWAGLDDRFYVSGYVVGAGSNNNAVILSTNTIADVPAVPETESSGIGTTDTALVYDLNLKAWSVWPSQNAVALWRVRDPSTGIEEVFAGGRDGNVRVLNRPSATNTFTATVRHVSALGAQGIEKSPRYLFLYFKESGAYTVTVRTYMDFSPTASVNTTVSLLGSGSVWGTFVWGTGVWGAQAQIIKRVDLKGVGEFMTLEIENAVAGQGFTLLGYEVLYRPRRLVRR